MAGGAGDGRGGGWCWESCGDRALAGDRTKEAIAPCSAQERSEEEGSNQFYPDRDKAGGDLL